MIHRSTADKLGPSNAYDDSFVDYPAAITQPGGTGAVVWDATDYEEHADRPHGKPVDLWSNFLDDERCPPIVRALIEADAGTLLERVMGDIRLLGCSSPFAAFATVQLIWSFKEVMGRRVCPCQSSGVRNRAEPRRRSEVSYE